MFAHNKRLQYTVRVSETNPGRANLMLEQFGGPPGKLPGDARFTNVYFNMSQGEPEKHDPWNQGEQWQFVSDREQQMAVDGGSGLGSVQLSTPEAAVLEKMAMRTMSDPSKDPVTGAELKPGKQGGSGTVADGAPGAKPAS